MLLPVIAEVGDVKGRARVCRAGQGSKRRSRIWLRVWEGRDRRVEIGGSFSGRDMVVCFAVNRVWAEWGPMATEGGCEGGGRIRRYNLVGRMSEE